MSNVFYYYTLEPCPQTIRDRENTSEIDLNTSNDYLLLFAGCEEAEEADMRKLQYDRMDFITNHPEEMNLTAHLTRELKSLSDLTAYDIACQSMLNAVMDGKYGKDPISFFQGKDNIEAQEKILYHLVQKQENGNRIDYFQSVLRDIFSNDVLFYYDRIKRTLYISFIAEGTAENRNIFEICKYFFADLFMKTEVRWRSYPLIIGRTDYAVAAEGEQLCGTIL